MSEEEWRPILSSFHYEVSNEGRVRLERTNTRHGPILRSTLRNGTAYVNFPDCWSWTRVPHPVCRLVAEAFLDYESGSGKVIRYVDGDPMNCRVDNLEVEE